MADEFETSVQGALEATRQGQWDEAERRLHRAMQLQPGAAVPHFLLAANYAQRGMTDLAEGAYIACLSRAPGFGVARFQLGLLQLTNGRAAAARASWELLLQADGDRVLRCFAQGLLDIAEGNGQRGADLLREGMALNHDNPALNADMQGVLSRLAASLPGDTADQGGATAQRRASPPDEAVPADHFLISVYRQT